MNELIEVLNEKYSNLSFRYKLEEELHGGLVLIIYYAKLRVHLYGTEVKFYKTQSAYKSSYLYDLFHTCNYGLDKDEYFNFSTQFDVHEFFLKENIDIILSRWNNLPQCLTIINIEKK